MKGDRVHFQYTPLLILFLVACSDTKTTSPSDSPSDLPQFENSAPALQMTFDRVTADANAKLPIVIVSGYFYPDDPTIEGALQAGLIAAFVGKPFDHDEIVSVITRYACR